MSKTMSAAAAGLAIVLTDAPAIGEAVKDSHGPGLVETMMATQSHHTKLWLAGNARNWELAEYQVEELKEGLEDAAKHIPDYKGVPVGSMIESLMLPPIVEVESAIKARDREKFAVAFDKATAACNTCHVGANRGFIVIQRPATSAFPNQSFHQSESKNSPILDRNVAAFNPAEFAQPLRKSGGPLLGQSSA